MASLPLPDFLFDTHKRYKADTNRVAQWLAETAQKCGFVLGVQPTPQPALQPRTGPRLKGKERKEARLANPPPAITPSTAHIVTVKGFTNMAQFIVRQTPAICVPDTIFELLRSAISLRKKCSSWFQQMSNPKKELRESDDKHSHFIGVLETVLEILKPRSRSAGSGSDVRRSIEKMNLNGKPDVPADESNNPFDVLFIEEDSVPEIPPPVEPRGVPQSKQTAPPPPPVRYEMEATDEEILFGVFCFFYDLNELKAFILDNWRRYKDGTCDLITASVTTNCAFELAHCAETDFITLFPKCDTFKKMSRTIYDSMCISRGLPLPPNDRSDRQIYTCMMDVGDWLFMRVADVLDVALELIEPEKNAYPGGLNSHVVVSYPRRDRKSLSREQFKEELGKEGYILNEAFIEIHTYHFVVQKGVPVPDKFVAGYQFMFTDKIVRTWVAFCTQVYLDIRLILRKHVDLGFKELAATAAHAKSTLTRYFSSSQKSRNLSKKDDEDIRAVQRFLDIWVISDPVKNRKPPEFKYEGTHRLLRRNPILAGLYQFKIHLLMQIAGVMVSSAHGSILSIAHLYEVCRQGGYSAKLWPDMELIMDIHTREQMFAGRVPTTPDDALKSIMLVMGFSPTTFARNRRNTRTNLSKQGARVLRFNSPVTDLLQGRYLGLADSGSSDSGHANTPLTLETVEALLEDRAVTTTAIPAPGVDGRENVLRQQWNRSHKLTVRQLLETLCDATAAEQYMLRFDYFALHRRCIALLQQLRDLFGEKLCQYQIRPRECKDELSAVVYHILQVARGTSHGDVYAGDELGDGKSEMMKQTSEVIDKIIVREGRLEREKLVNMPAVSLPTNVGS
jgi:hypothetical protein